VSHHTASNGAGRDHEANIQSKTSGSGNAAPVNNGSESSGDAAMKEK
jgi:hypothetical protein